MFKAIIDFLKIKPKVEEKPAECPYKAEAAPAPTPAPVTEEIKITTVTLNDQITDAITVTAKPDTVPTGAWPFPSGEPPVEQKKKRTFVKREEATTDKKPTPAIKTNKTKPRKKK